MSVADEIESREDKLTLGFFDFIEALLIQSRVTLLPQTTQLIMDGVEDINLIFKVGAMKHPAVDCCYLSTLSLQQRCALLILVLSLWWFPCPRVWSLLVLSRCCHECIEWNQEPEDAASKAKHPAFGRQVGPHGDGDLRSFVLYHPGLDMVPLTSDDQFLEAVGEAPAPATGTTAAVDDKSVSVPVQRQVRDDDLDLIPIEIQQGINEAHNVVFNNLLRFMIFKKHHEDCENGPGGRQIGASGGSPTQ